MKVMRVIHVLTEEVVEVPDDLTTDEAIEKAATEKMGPLPHDWHIVEMYKSTQCHENQQTHYTVQNDDDGTETPMYEWFNY